tara:strand:- start:449 stop:598 length:150 start_codon:yes stop_codon:yes gene_type:complete
MASSEHNNPSRKRNERERKADSGQASERLAFAMALALLWLLGLWFVLTH